jgi:hypothetical protein
LIKPHFKNTLATLEVDEGRPWIAQIYLEGTQFCSYSVCHKGHITAHATYRSEFTAGKGAAVHFKHEDNAAVFEWVRKFVDHYKISGQVAFDFIQTNDGRVYAIECNPRATSGLHLLASNPKFIDAFLNPELECVFPQAGESHMIGLAMLLYALPASMRTFRPAAWTRAFFSASDVIFSIRDPMPFLMQFTSLIEHALTARANKISMLQASTFDIEWNGHGA